MITHRIKLINFSFQAKVVKKWGKWCLIPLRIVYSYLFVNACLLFKEI